MKPAKPLLWQMWVQVEEGLDKGGVTSPVFSPQMSHFPSLLLSMCFSSYVTVHLTITKQISIIKSNHENRKPNIKSKMQTTMFFLTVVLIFFQVSNLWSNINLYEPFITTVRAMDNFVFGFWPYKEHGDKQSQSNP